MGLHDARPCPCGSGLLSTWEYDTNGIPLCRTCEICHAQKMGRYRAGVVGGRSVMDLKEVLRLHALWLNDDEGGERADLREADLEGAKLRWADLREADLGGANLGGADLTGANLGRANLRGADLGGADQTGANLGRANLGGANLRGADLGGAKLRWADLREADLEGAKLGGADLEGANLRGANLRGADLDYAAWPLWCGSFDAKADRRLAAQLAYHFCRIDFGDDAVCLVAQDALVTLANEFHRVGECGVPPIQQRGSPKRGGGPDVGWC